MKIRKGFVSNSSSSSFVCDVTGEIESGWDLCLSECEMSECEKGHVFYNSYIANKDKLQEIKDHYYETDELPDGMDEDCISGYELPSMFCPICTMEHLSDSDIKKYLYKKLDITLQDIVKEIKDKFTTYSEFRTYID